MLHYSGTWYKVGEKSPPRDKKIMWYSNLSGVSIVGYADNFLLTNQDYWTLFPVAPNKLIRGTANDEVHR